MPEPPEKMKSFGDLESDGGSDVLGQVRQQRRRTREVLKSFRRVLAIGSGKGGVGKSTVTMLLALALKELQACPALLDADLNGPTQSALAALGVSVPIPSRDGLVVPTSPAGIGVLSAGSYLPEGRSFDLPSVSSGDSFVWRASKEFSVLGELLQTADWGGFDHLLIDLPPGSERMFQYAEFLAPEVEFILVTQPSSISSGVVRRSISALQQAGATILGLVENMSRYHCPNCGEEGPLFPELDRGNLSVPYLGAIPFDPMLAEACDRGISQHFFSESPLRKGLLAIAQGVLGTAARTRKAES